MEASAAAVRSGFQWVSESNRSILFNALDAITGPKVIVWDPSLMQRFDLVAKSEQLKQHKVVSMLKLGSGPLTASVEHNHVVYIVPSTTTAVKKLIIHISQRTFREDRRLHHVLFVPDASLALRDRLKENRDTCAMLKSIESLTLRVFPLYEDFFVLFMADTPAKLLINKDWTELHKCASALRQIELLGPVFPNIRCKGKWSAQIAEMLKKIIAQGEESFTSRGEWNISDIVIIDRWLDPLTPMLTQLTYGGLIDEIFTLLPSGGIMTTLFASEGDEERPRYKPLNDELFFVLRDLHISDVGKTISSEVKEVIEVHKNLKEHLDASLTQTKVFVRKLTEMKMKERDADKHTVIASHLTSIIRDDTRFRKFAKLEREILRGEYGDRVIPFVEDLIIEAYNPEYVLRFISLQSIVCGGLKPATYAAYQRIFVQSYGIYQITLWLKLQLMGLIYEKMPRIKCDYAPFDFHLTNKRLGCLPDHYSEEGTAYPYCGYTPALIKHVETGVNTGWKDWTSVMSPDRPEPKPDSTTLVFVVGGITMAEAACLRRIKFPNNLVIMSTSMVSGKQIIRSVESL